MGRLHVFSHRCSSQNVWNGFLTESVMSGVIITCKSVLLGCVGVIVFALTYMCILLRTSSQTLGSTHAWQPAPVVKHLGVLSWKSKVQFICKRGERNVLRIVRTQLCLAFFSLSVQNQGEWRSWKATMRMNFLGHRPSLRSQMSPRTACRCPGNQGWPGRHLCPLTSSRHSGVFQRQHHFSPIGFTAKL